MDSAFTELLFIFLLILVNGFFSGSELAIISARKSTMSRLSTGGDKRAETVERLQNDPHRFLATVQIGVNVVGSLASVLGGTTAAKHLQPLLAAAPYPLISKAAEPISMAIVVLAISYVTLILGELAPKTIGLQYADKMALIVAKPIALMAGVTSFAVKFLTLSNRAALALLGITPTSGQEFITREEVLHTVAECGETGVLTEHERTVIENMLDFGATLTSEVMVPRVRMVAFDINMPRQELLKQVAEHQYTRYPVYKGNQDNILGFVHSKDLLLNPQLGLGCSLDQALRPLSYVPESQRASDLLRSMQLGKTQMALVVDEYGAVRGLVTIEDLLEELVGDIRDEYDEDEGCKSICLPDGSLVVDGLTSRNDLEEILDIKFEEGLPYDTLAGLILCEIGRIPVKGEQICWREFEFTCEEVTVTSIRKVKISRPAQGQPEE